MLYSFIVFSVNNTDSFKLASRVSLGWMYDAPFPAARKLTLLSEVTEIPSSSAMNRTVFLLGNYIPVIKKLVRNPGFSVLKRDIMSLNYFVLQYQYISWRSIVI